MKSLATSYKLRVKEIELGYRHSIDDKEQHRKDCHKRMMNMFQEMSNQHLLDFKKCEKEAIDARGDFEQTCKEKL